MAARLAYGPGHGRGVLRLVIQRLRDAEPFSPLRYRMHLTGDALAACEVQGGKVLRKHRFLFAIEARHEALQALGRWMNEATRGFLQGGSQEWVLGSTVVRYMLLPWTPDLANPALRQAFATAVFEQKFKLDPNGYTMCWADLCYGQGALVACVHQPLLDELRAHADASKVRLVSIAPGAAIVWNRFKKILATEEGTVCLIDGDRQLLLQHDRSRIRDIALRPFDADADADADAGMVALPWSDAGRWRVFSSVWLPRQPEDMRLALADGEGFRTKEDAAYSFALCGIY